MTKFTVIEVESTLTDRYQTTIPASVRNVLGLSKKDKICYVIHQDGTVTIAKNNVGKEDLALAKFLDFLAADIQTSPQNIKAVNSNLKRRVDKLVAGVEVDLDQPLNEEDD
ncbi:MAG: type II toxin-antitoxin system PrlF family antitoxin [Waterburya sp.]